MADEEARLRQWVTTELHDGAQQHLVMLMIMLQLLRQALAAQPAEAAQLLEQAGEQARLAISGVREVVAGVLPPPLTSRGLLAGVQTLAEDASLPVEISGSAVRRFDPVIEVHAYFFVAQALTNAIERRASAVTVTIEASDAFLVVEISSRGSRETGPDQDVDRLRHIGDRVIALGGTFAVRSAAGTDTTLSARFPFPGRPTRSAL